VSQARRADDRGSLGKVPPSGGRAAAGRIVLVYALVGALWILFSDLALEALVDDAASRAGMQTAKGAVYVLATAGLLFALIDRNQKRLAARDRSLRGVLDGMPDAVLVAGPDGSIVDGNAAATRLFGIRPSPERPVPFDDYVRTAAIRLADGSALTLEASATGRALRGETVTAFEATLRAADGRELTVNVSAAPVRGSHGETEAAVIAMRDVTEAKRLDGLREEFMATAAHELKTPLAVVKAYAQLMRKRGQGDPRGLDAITRQTDRLNRIVHQILDVARFRAGAGDLRRERFDLAALTAEVVARMQRAAGGRLSLEHGPAEVVADRERIAQVVESLLENALRFSPAGGPVEARVARDAREVVVSVRDRGVGIPADRQPRVFERFYRAHAGTAEDYGGLGLGLDVSREVVERHGGRIWFESEEGRGSTFSFSLPVVAREAE
jgi:two-component system phosphate regulon sensor histidine kinase PhoR